LKFVQGFSSSDLAALDGTTFGVGLIFPVQNLMRAAILSLNENIVRCRGSVSIDDPGSIYAYSGPIVLLLIQIVAFFTLLIWVDGSTFSFSKAKILRGGDAVKSTLSGRPDVDAETDRVVASPDDQLRMLHVSKSFGSQEAVSDVSLGLRKGEILALLGPNGAGKTTAINMIRGDLTPSSGDIFLKGVNVHKNMRLAQKHLGVCPQFDALDLLTVRQQLVFYARCKGVVDQKNVVDYAMSKVGISAHAKKPVAKLSGGNKRKLSLAIALIDNPPVLLLDEPSSAMDAASKRVLWATLRAVAPGRSVLITTHSMEEADALATRAAIISKKLLAIGSTQQLRERHSNELIVHLILNTAPLSSDEEMMSVADWVRHSFPAVQFEGANLGGQVRFIVPADSEVPHAASASGNLSATAVSAGAEDSAPGPQARLAKSFWGYLVQTLEREKESLDLQSYTIGTATMERVFMSVVKESNLAEEEDEKKTWWRW
jgi:ATP-binding cassette subfamily A (ABC1) protein 3